jgi:hypothetical protein
MAKRVPEPRTTAEYIQRVRDLFVKDTLLSQEQADWLVKHPQVVQTLSQAFAMRQSPKDGHRVVGNVLIESFVRHNMKPDTPKGEGGPAGTAKNQ